MRLTGTLRSWNDDRGFGFIAPTGGGVELFVHISALPRDGSRPTVGERLSYELGRGADGRPQAIKVMRDAIGSSPVRARSSAAAPRARRRLTKIAWPLLLLAAGGLAFQHFQGRQPPIPNASAPLHAEIPDPVKVERFQCDGRRHCSQMSSCEEARYFLKHCPATEMDGDGDGIPCEQQWC